MLCDICHKKKARIYYTEIIDGKKTEQHLCEDCVATHTSFFSKQLLQGDEFKLGSILSGLLEGSAQVQDVEEPEQTLACEFCGLLYEDFLKNGKFGCAHCYQSFDRILQTNFRHIQGAVQHVGKHPKQCTLFSTDGIESKEGTAEQQVDVLTTQLQQAIAAEEFEEAARLRDLIRSLS